MLFAILVAGAGLSISLCITLSHQPELIILTLTLFALLSFSSWAYFDLQQKTIREKAERDSNQEKQALELLGKNQELKKVNQELDHFVYRVSHDLRSPLSSAQGLVSLLNEEKDPVQKGMYFNLLEDCFQRMDSRIQDIIQFSRNSRLEVEAERIGFREIIDRILEVNAVEIDQGGTDVKITIEQDRPFHTDQHRLKIILNNIIQNAIKYRDESRPQHLVSIRIGVNEAGARIEVRDNGIGIPATYQDKIFDMFFRATHLKPGSGLGLYVARQSLQKLRGTIGVDSREGKGTTFSIFIPHVDHTPESFGSPVLKQA